MAQYPAIAFPPGHEPLCVQYVEVECAFVESAQRQVIKLSQITRPQVCEMKVVNLRRG